MGYQLSQIHLCADVANFPLDATLLRRLVTHSISQQVHIPSDGETDDALDVEIHYDDDFALFDEEDDPYLSDDLLAIALAEEEVIEGRRVRRR